MVDANDIMLEMFCDRIRAIFRNISIQLGSFTYNEITKAIHEMSNLLSKTKELMKEDFVAANELAQKHDPNTTPEEWLESNVIEEVASISREALLSMEVCLKLNKNNYGDSNGNL